MKKIIIFGAGISGLTVAHELVEKGFNVEVHETDYIPGGMARSTRTLNDTPSEHSWRGYGPFYYNTYDILGRLKIKSYQISNQSDNNLNVNSFTPEEVALHNTVNDAWIIYKNGVYDITKFIKSHPGGNLIKNALGRDIELVWKEFNMDWHNNKKSVFNTLEKYKIGSIKNYNTKIINETVVNNLVPLHFNHLSAKINFIDYPFLIYIFCKQLLCNKRKKHYFNKKFINYMDYVSNDTKNYLVNFLAGPGYGFDKKDVSVGHYFLFLLYVFVTENKTWMVMNGPTNESWINIWVNYLINKGVTFKFNSSLKQINYYQNKIINCITNNKILIADEYVLCINPNNLEKIFYNSNMYDLYKVHKKINTTNDQISFRLGFNKNIKLPKNEGFVLINSPYNITFYAADNFWNNTYLGENIKSLWSGTLVITYQRGFNNKTALECSIPELLDEIILQIFSDNYINTLNVCKNDIVYKEIFEDWYWNGKNLESKNKKWVNNIYNEKYRPSNITHYNNLYLGGAHTKTSVNIWLMEGAVESGKMVSNCILNKYNIPECNLFTFKIPLIINNICKIDDIFYNLNLPHFIDLLVMVIVIVIIFKKKLFRTIRPLLRYRTI